MEKFNADEKMMVLMKLPAEEVFVVCETSKEMNQICKKEQYSDMWQSKIKTEYNVDSKEIKGRDGYEKYKYLDQLYNQTFYTVLSINMNDPRYSSSELFDTRGKAEKFVYARVLQYIDDEVSYSKIKLILSSSGQVNLGPFIYKIEETVLNWDEAEEFEEVDLEREKRDMKFINENLEEVDELINDFNKKYGLVKPIGNRLIAAKNMIHKFVDSHKYLSEENKNRAKEILERIFL